MFPDRPWGPGDNPKTAVWEYLKTHTEFEIDKSIDHKLLISVAPDGYLNVLAIKTRNSLLPPVPPQTTSSPTISAKA